VNLKLSDRLLTAALAAVCAGWAAPAGAQIYAGTNGSGAVVLSNFQSGETPDLVIQAPVVPALAPIAAVVATPAQGTTPDALRAAQFKPMIQRIAQETSVSPLLLHAVVSVESGYDAKAVSRKGAQGLMQLMPQTAQRFGVRNALDPLENLRGGALYLKWLLAYFDGDLKLALAGYNAGEQEVVRAGYRIPANKETRAYVPKVLARLNRPIPS
jgi:soluble lytic murein transglycosylase-like protein